MAEESRLQSKVLQMAKLYGHFWKIHGGAYQERGVPDIVGVVGGMMVAMELKASNGKLTALQAHHLTQVTENGGISFVVYPHHLRDLEDALGVIKETSHGKAIPERIVRAVRARIENGQVLWSAQEASQRRPHKVARGGGRSDRQESGRTRFYDEKPNQSPREA